MLGVRREPVSTRHSAVSGASVVLGPGAFSGAAPSGSVICLTVPVVGGVTLASTRIAAEPPLLSIVMTPSWSPAAVVSTTTAS